jgi:pyruvate ferredoxin oxidoreductase delta subunit
MKKKLEIESFGSLRNKTGDWRVYVPRFLEEKCVGCGICAKVCPEGICHAVQKKLGKNGKPIYTFDPEYCKGCGICAKECPFGAIKMELEKKGNAKSC